MVTLTTFICFQKVWPISLCLKTPLHLIIRSNPVPLMLNVHTWPAHTQSEHNDHMSWMLNVSIRWIHVCQSIWSTTSRFLFRENMWICALKQPDEFLWLVQASQHPPPLHTTTSVRLSDLLIFVSVFTAHLINTNLFCFLTSVFYSVDLRRTPAVQLYPTNQWRWSLNVSVSTNTNKFK